MIEARMAIRYNEHEMAAWYAERQDGWVRASEEFQPRAGWAGGGGRHWKAQGVGLQTRLEGSASTYTYVYIYIYIHIFIYVCISLVWGKMLVQKHFF